MLETVITLKPKIEWRRVDTWYSALGAGVGRRGLLRHITPDHISQTELIGEMNEALSLPGLANAWTMPIKGRIDMLSTGLRTPVGLKISGADLDTIEEIGTRIEALLPTVQGTRSVFAERTGQRLLPRRRVEPRGTRPLRPQHREAQSRGRRTPSAATT